MQKSKGARLQQRTTLIHKTTACAHTFFGLVYDHKMCFRVVLYCFPTCYCAPSTNANHLSVPPSIHPSIHPSVHPSIHPSIHPSTNLPTCLPTYLSTWLCVLVSFLHATTSFMKVDRAFLLVVTLRLRSSSFSGFIYRILKGNPKKELLWSLWVGCSSCVIESI